ncbi:MAG: multicopper oxidase domain-containing protein [Omnitrophica WOR_2 bacterium]
MITRRDFLKFSAAAGVSAFLASRSNLLQRVSAAQFQGNNLVFAPLVRSGSQQQILALQQGTALPGSSIPQFVDPLPLLSVAGGPMETILAGADEIELNMLEFQASVMPSTFVPAAGTYTGTWVWGYRAGITPYNPAGTYLGPVIVATRNQPTQIRFVNNLTADHIAWREWTDQTLHWADPLNDESNMCAHGMPMDYCGEHYQGPIPAVPHLHGGEVPPVLDGGPDAWFTSDGAYHGHGFYSMDGNTDGNYAIYCYPNSMEAAPIWFHDHLLGGTRLNVYAGLAGAYPIIDPNLALPTGLHPIGLQQGASGPVDYLVPLVLQDRMFDTNGQLFFPNVGINPEHPFWVPEFVGDTIVVNGKVWPFLNVAPKRYRFLVVNGSNARTYELFLANPKTKVMGPPIWQICTDGGYLDAPVKIDPNAPKGQLQKLVLMPGERADVIVDFAGLAGQTLILRNTGRTPYPKGAAPGGTTLGQIIQIRVNQPFSGPDLSYNPASGTPLRLPMVRLVNPTAGTLAAGVTAQHTRQLTLNEIMGMGGPLEILVNNTKWDGKRGDGTVRNDFTPVTINGITDYYSELPKEGDTEVWEIVNLTADAHPMHTHLTQFQLINRQAFNTNNYNAAYAAAFPGALFIPAYGPPLDYNTGNARALGGNPDITPFLQGPTMLPDPNEAGWKDTIHALPGQVTRIAVRFAPMDNAINDPNLTYPFDPNAEGHGYVWHCHIVDHEDNEMMRPYAVTPKDGATRTYVQGEDY